MAKVIDATFKYDAPPSQSEPDLDPWSDESGSSELPKNETPDEKDDDKSEAQSDARVSVPFANLSTPDIREKDAGDDAQRDEQDTKPLDLRTGKTRCPSDVGDVHESLFTASILTEGDSSDNDVSLFDKDEVVGPKSSSDSGIIDLGGLMSDPAPNKGDSGQEDVDEPGQFESSEEFVKKERGFSWSSKGSRNKLVPITILVGFGMLSCAIVVAASILSKKPVSLGDSAAVPLVTATPKLAGVVPRPVLEPLKEPQDEDPSSQPLAAEMPAAVPGNAEDVISRQPLSADTLVIVPEDAANEIETKPITAQNKGHRPIQKDKVAAPHHGTRNNKTVVKTADPPVATETIVSEKDEEPARPTTSASQTVPADPESTHEQDPDPQTIPPDPESTHERAPGPQTVPLDAVSTREQAPLSGSAIDKLLVQALEKPTGRKTADSEDAIPATLSRSQVQSTMKKVEPAVKKCASDMGAQGVANVKLDVSGANGMINKIQVPSVPESLRECIAREVRKARFPRFKNETMAIQYPFVFPFQ